MQSPDSISPREAAERLSAGLIFRTASLPYLRNGLVFVGALIFVSSWTQQFLRWTGHPLDPIGYRIVWGITLVILLAGLAVLRLRMRKDSGQTVLERVAHRLIWISVASSAALSAVIFSTPFLQPRGTNLILLLIHALCFAVPPLHITKAFFRGTLVFCAGTVCTIVVPEFADCLYGTSWLLACLFILARIQKESAESA